MRAKLLKGVTLLTTLMTAHGALAQGSTTGRSDDRPNVDFALTQEGAPEAKPWEKPGVLSVTIDRKGKDFFEAHLNAELQFNLSRRIRKGEETGAGAPPVFLLGPSASWNRSSQPGSLQDELKMGLATHYIHDADIFRANSEHARKSPLFYSIEGNFDYARTGVYPDKDKAPCNATNSSPLCRKQFKESLKGKLSFFPYLPEFEDLLGPNSRWGYSIRPEFQIAHDQILDGTLDPTTLAKVTGGYTSVLAGLGLNLRPTFIDPKLEINLTGQVRQRVAVSSSRRGSIDRTAGLFEASVTYFLGADDPEHKKKNWRAGVSVIFTEGSDPFDDKPKASTIVIAFRLGHL